MNKNEFSRPLNTMSVDRNGQVEQIEASADECLALAKRFDIESIANFKAKLLIKPKADKMTYHISGHFDADIVQTCIITAKPINSHAHDKFEAWYRDVSKVTPFKSRHRDVEAADESDEHEIRPEEEDPEIINDGVLDLGEIASQFLALAIDPYPKAEGVDEGDYIEVKESDKPNPFAKLAALKTKE